MSQELDFEIFKNVIVDLVTNRSQRPMSNIIDEECDADKPAADFIKKYYCANPAQDRFIVTRFVLYRTENKVVLEYENTTNTTGSGAIVGYDYDEEGNVSFGRFFNGYYVDPNDYDDAVTESNKWTEDL